MRAPPFLLVIGLGLAGCQGVPSIVENPLVVQSTMAVPLESRYDFVWDEAIRVLERYFVITYENRYDGRIETQPLAAATLFEPWRPDSIGFYDRLHATCQTIRRRAFILIRTTPTGEFEISVEVYKELEDLRLPTYTQFGGGSFISSIEPTREALVTSPVAPANGWISLGRDTKLEAVILEALHRRIELGE